MFMKKQKNIIAAVAALMSMTAGAQLAQAEWMTGSQANIVADAVSQSIAANAAVYAIDDVISAGWKIRIDILGGAKFNVAPTLTPAGVVGAAASTAPAASTAFNLGSGNAVAAPSTLGGAGSTFAEWSVTGAAIAPNVVGVGTVSAAAYDKVTLNSTAANFLDMTGVATKGKVDLKLSVVNAAGSTLYSALMSAAAPAKFATNAIALNATEKAAAEAGGKGIDFAVKNVTFTTSPTAKSDTVTVGSGYLKFNTTLTGTTAGYTIDSAAGLPNTETMIVTLSGNFSGIQSVTAASALTGSDAAGVTTNGTAGEFLIDAVAGKAYGVITSGTAGNSSTDIAPTLVLDGVTAQTSAGDFTISAVSKASATVAASTADAGTVILSMARDGSVFSLNSFGPANTLKLTDRSNSVLTGGAAVAVTAYDAAGTKVNPIAAATALGTIPANGTLSITGTTLTANYPGAVRFDVTVDSKDIVASNIKKTASGVTVTVITPGTSTNAAL